MNALELRGLTKHYKDFTLGPLDLTLPGGTICGLIGENGAGKSTTIKLILDMLQSSQKLPVVICLLIMKEKKTKTENILNSEIRI